MLKDRMKAGYPLLYLPTEEYQRAAEYIKGAAREVGLESEQLSFDVGIWSATTGLVVNDEDQGAVKELPEALKVIQDRTRENPMVGIFMNLRQMLANYLIIQVLLDTATQARLNGSHVIIVGPEMDIPPELRGIITHVDFPLPDREKIAELFRSLLEAYREDVDLTGVEDEDALIDQAAGAALGMTEMEAESAIALSIAKTNRIDIPTIQGEKEQAVRKSGVLEFVRRRESMDNVGDCGLLKDWVRRRRKVFSPRAREYGLPFPKGILMIGIPGSGKSLMAKAISDFLELPLIRFDLGRVFKSLVGQSEATVRGALQVAETVAPIVLWIDEIEKAFAGVQSSGQTDSGVTSRVLQTVLTWMQENTAPIFIVATSNDIAKLPPEVYRAGRFDQIWATDLPQLEGRAEIFDIHLRKRDRDPEQFDVQLIAKEAKGFVGSEIEMLIEDAMFRAFDDGERELATDDIVLAIKEAYPQSRTDYEKIKKIREFCQQRARPVSSNAPSSKDGQKGGDGVRQVRSKKVERPDIITIN